jgi:polar amino acid transport system permease protein
MVEQETLFAMLGYLLQGAGITLSVTLIALSVGFALGTTGAVLRVYGGPVLARLASAYSTVVRAAPVVVIIFILYFVIARFVDLSPFLSGSLALGFASGAYQSEIFHGAILAVPPGQMMAARAIGMSRLAAVRFIVLPQALRLAIPAWANEVTLVLKDSTLVFVIGVPEILRRAQYVSARTLQALLAYGAAALIYLAFTFVASQGLNLLERRTRLLM